MCHTDQSVSHKLKIIYTNQFRPLYVSEDIVLKMVSHETTFYHHHQLVRTRPYGLSQFRITSEIMNQFRHMVGLLGRGISPSQRLYLHRTAQHKKTRTNIHALSGIRTHDPNIQEATVTGSIFNIILYTRTEVRRN
jgi:hypothetical protein